MRREDGDIMVVATTNVKTTPKSESLDSISTVTFDFVEIGKMDYNTMTKSGLIASAGKSVYTYDENGDIKWNQERNNDDARKDNSTIQDRIKRYRNSFDEVNVAV